MSKEILLTADGLKDLKDQLEYLKTEKRNEIAEKIKEALSFGDLSENAEYDAAKNEQAEVEEKIIKLENTIKNARIIEDDNSGDGVVTIGCKVKLYDKEFDEEIIYKVVGSTEANPAQYKISNESPLGASLLGKKEGDEVEVNAPQGIMEFKILEVTK
ncbi:MAG: transcription elongation factor GreA [Ruminococcaceae bacterium]|nr:transcription elongation factor GreA [Oscillospiraceae bacterium]